ncbi:MAG: M15 family metallopeptidase [Treponema sp.]|jgi:hypothetical protein|nr:M15 family metallopeptidase [Treponema sp.]
MMPAVWIPFFGALFAWLLIGCSPKKEIPPEFDLRPIPSTLAIADDAAAQERIMRVFVEAYPEKISAVEFLDNDWTMLVKGQRFYYANGRFLPERVRDKWEDYLPYDFYTYPWAGTIRQRQAAYKYPVYSVGSSFLFDALYNMPSEDDSWELQEKYSFLGVKLLIHPEIKPLLDRVANLIRRAAQTDSSINEWIAELQTGVANYGWSWRSIANTSRRSNHSYGTAIDLLPKDMKGRKTYWQWDSDATTTQDFYLPPEAVIKAFEDNGFIWGGNWDLIDTMHFEYRPEILLLNNFPVFF